MAGLTSDRRVNRYRVHMVRRGQQGERKLRQARREAAEQLDSNEGRYQLPDREDCRFKQWETIGDDAATVRTQTLTWRKGGALVNFVINLQVITPQGWETVERIDCCHGCCHYHPRNGTETRPILRLDVVDEVQTAYSAAQQLILERLRIIRG